MYERLRNFINRLRTIFWSSVFAKFGKHSKIFGRIVVIRPRNIEIGDYSTLNDNIHLNAREKIIIGDYVRISSGCAFHTGGLDYKKPIDKRNHLDKPIIIEDGVWLGANVVVTSGVRIGTGSVIGAGSVVTSDIPSGVIAFGVPAKVYKRIEFEV